MKVAMDIKERHAGYRGHGQQGGEPTWRRMTRCVFDVSRAEKLMLRSVVSCGPKQT